MDINHRIAERLHALRSERGLSLDALAGRSGVSRSNISLIERGRSSPTATVLDRLATALGVTVASMFEQPVAPSAPPSPLARVAEQPVWAPPGVSPIQLVDVVFPAGQRVAYDTAAREVEIHQQVWMIDGTMDVTVGADHWRLEAGDCLAFRLDRPTAYRNPTRRPARYLVALVNVPAGLRRTS
jgi:transcriptional regulator with XRE-family HTH domain